MPLQTAIQDFDDALQRLQSRMDGRIRALEAEVAALRIERDMLIEQIQMSTSPPPAAASENAAGDETPSAEVAALLDELDAMATAHDALIQRYGDLELRHAQLEQAARTALDRVAGLIATVETEST